jgi:GT2 family glycosyltransferase
MNSNICAIVVTYNRLNLLKECIEALKMSSMAVDILIIDNDSTDGTRDYCKDVIADNKNGKIIYHNTGSNLGGAGGFNIGLRKAYELGYDYFWLMDDDTIVGVDSLQELFRVGHELNGRWGFLSSNAYFTDGTICKMNGYEISGDWTSYRELCAKGIIKVDRATFVSFFVSRSIVEEIGLPIKEYFIWGDDTEYSYRISKLFPCYFVARSKVVHKISDNLDTKDIAKMEDKNRILRMELSLRNDCCTYRRLGLKMFARYTFRTIRKLKQSLVANNLKALKIKVIIKGYVLGLFFNPKIENM